jgi:hypothetical protein
LPDQPRRVYITLGKKSYSILTRLEEKRFARVAQIAKESLEGIDSSNEQEERLLLACFKLAYCIESAEGRIRGMTGESENE